jgi:DNA-binding transcriptional LysR family regulator
MLRLISALEHALGARLFDRTPSGYVLTVVGAELRDRLVPIAEQIDGAQRLVAGRDLELSGSIR